METESEYKSRLIKTFNNNKWIDGDNENNTGKKADIVNHDLKIAIEIKDDSTDFKLDLISSSIDLNLLNKRILDDARDASKKFSNYKNYKTILIIRSECPVPEIFKYAAIGLNRYKVQDHYISEISKISKYPSNRVWGNIGCVLLYTNSKYYYFCHPTTPINRKFNYSEINILLGIEMSEI